jgi:hypothetical protein
VQRVRDILGHSAVVSVGRSALSKRCTVCILISSGSSSVIGTIRKLLETDPHMASVLSRVYLLSNCDDKNNDNDKESDRENGLADNNFASIEAAVHRIRELALHSPSLPLRIRARGFPKEVEAEATAALAAEVAAGRVAIATARDCDACLDAVRVWGRTHVAVWRPEQTRKQENDSEQEANNEEESQQAQGHDEQESRLRTLNDAVYRIEALKEGRVARAPVCRAYWKLEEGILRAAVPVQPDWLCADAGAAPGGWTQVDRCCGAVMM